MTPPSSTGEGLEERRKILKRKREETMRDAARELCMCMSEHSFEGPDLDTLTVPYDGKIKTRRTLRERRRARLAVRDADLQNELGAVFRRPSMIGARVE